MAAILPLEDRVALILGRAIIRAESLQVQLDLVTQVKPDGLEPEGKDTT